MFLSIDSGPPVLRKLRIELVEATRLPFGIWCFPLPFRLSSFVITEKKRMLTVQKIALLIVVSFDLDR